MTDNLKVPTAILDKFAQKQGYKNYEDSKQYRSIEQIHWFRELASLAYSEGFEHKDFEQCEKSCPFVSQHKMEGKLAVLNEMDKLIMGTSTIDALEGGVIALDCYYIHADRYNKLKSQIKDGEKR